MISSVLGMLSLCRGKGKTIHHVKSRQTGQLFSNHDTPCTKNSIPMGKITGMTFRTGDMRLCNSDAQGIRHAIKLRHWGAAGTAGDFELKIGTPKEIFEGEARVAMTPESALQLQKLGHECVIETGAGAVAGFSDATYKDAGVTVVKTAAALWKAADVVAKVRAPDTAELKRLRADQTLISFFNPAGNTEGMEAAASKGATVIAMEMIPRISRAQKMDALSSMANIAGYRAVIEAGNNFGRFFTGQITAAGKVPPAKVLVVGAGVAGLAAIGTATSLGAITYAFDVRPEVAEQVESMGAEFVYLDFEEDQQDGAATGGYAAVSSPEFREAQLAKFRELAPEVDIVITTALIPNRDAPELWTEDMVKAMKPGSVIIDLAAEKGGNCKLTVMDQKIVTDNGVTIIGYTDFPSRMATQASTLYATNIRHLLTDLTPEKDGVIHHNMEDDVIRGATVTHEKAITFPPPPPKVAAIAAAPKKETPKALTAEEKRAKELADFKAATKQQVTLLAVGGALLLGVGLVAPASFMQHFIVFVLAVFVGFQVIWGVAHSLHTPLMAVTNAISSIIILGALMQIGSSSFLVIILAALSVFMCGINIFGGFLVTRRMLAMFQKS
ncbi:MAG: NAD(P) transhydrogenase subunit alpha [Sulfitobacter sp.]|jgi:NAD(P) transhydrogenase subunit alpha